MSGRIDGSHYNQTIGSRNCLVEVWRDLNPGKKHYSWYKPDGTYKSRIDYWLVTDAVMPQVSDNLISKAPLTDHCIIEIKLNC